MKKVTFPDTLVISTSVNTIRGLFYNSSIESVNWPSSSKIIPTDTFNLAVNLSSLTIPDGVTHIGSIAFKNSGITRIDMPNTVTFIGEKAFQNMYKLKYVEISKNAANIGSNLFLGSGVETVVFRDGFLNVPVGMFRNVSSLSNVTFPNSLQTIGSESFFGTKLSKVIIPPNVKIKELHKSATFTPSTIVFFRAPITEITFKYTSTTTGFFGGKAIKHHFNPKLIVSTLKFEPVISADNTKPDFDLTIVPDDTFTRTADALPNLTKVEYYSSVTIPEEDLRAKFPGEFITFVNTHPNPLP